MIAALVVAAVLVLAFIGYAMVCILDEFENGGKMQYEEHG